MSFAIIFMKIYTNEMIKAAAFYKTTRVLSNDNYTNEVSEKL